jgi:hypothetical protein
MPFRSQSQRALFHAKANRGEMPQATVDKWEAHTPKGKKLPEHVAKKAAPDVRVIAREFGARQARKSVLGP